MTLLSKTDFLWYLDAPMHLWASAHNQLEDKSHSLYEQHLLQQGQQVEALARKFIEQVLLPAYADAQLFWQPSYDDGDFKIRADALIFDREAEVYDLYEIKSSTSVKTKHEYDLAFQVLLLEQILNLRHIHIIHIDKTYSNGKSLDLSSFFAVEEVSEQVDGRREDVGRWRKDALAVLHMDTPVPSFACTKPQSCPCPSLCHPDLPESPVYNIPYIGKKAIQLREMGITAIEDIPPDFNLNIKQRKHFQAVKTGKAIIDQDAIKQSLSELEYPLHFLDYETFNPAIPLFTGYHPYEHIVFQYALFILNDPEAEPQHFDFLITDSIDPAPEIVPNLLGNLHPEGSVIVWNKHFEAGRNSDLAGHCPEYRHQLMGINNRLFDLMLIFKDGHYVHPEFHGSASLKAVLPVLCPDLRYDSLAISNGEEAMMTWYWLQTGEVSDQERAKLEAAMKIYCQRDTYGMVAIWRQLSKFLRSNNGS